MRKLKKGPADKSYGIAVAKLAGLPPAVIARAAGPSRLREGRSDSQSANSLPDSDLALAADRPEPRSDLRCPNVRGQSRVHRSSADLKSANLENLSPLQAFDLLLRLKQRLDAQSDTDRRGQPKPD